MVKKNMGSVKGIHAGNMGRKLQKYVKKKLLKIGMVNVRINQVILNKYLPQPNKPPASLTTHRLLSGFLPDGNRVFSSRSHRPRLISFHLLRSGFSLSHMLFHFLDVQHPRNACNRIYDTIEPMVCTARSARDVFVRDRVEFFRSEL